MSFLDKMFSRKVSQNEFAEIVRQAFAEQGLPDLEYDEKEFALRIPGKNSAVFLHNSYSNFNLLPRQERQAVVAKLVASFTSIPEIPARFAAAKPHLMPVVRDAAYYSLSRLLTRSMRSNDSELEWQSERFAGGLLLGLAYDTEHSISSVTARQLKEWGVELKEAFAAAKDNLWERTDPTKMVEQNGVFVAQWNDSYDSSRMMLTELIYRLSLDGEPVAFVPTRDTFLVTGKDNLAGLRAIVKHGSEAHFKQGHSLSPDLFVLVDGKWDLYIPDDPEVKAMWQQTRRRRAYLDYEQQKNMIDKIHEKTGKDYFVASFKILEGKEKGEFSVCVWTKGVDSSLPQADSIAFIVDPKRDMFVVPWDQAVEIAGGYMKEESGLIPPRFRARDFPGDDQVRRLRKFGMRM